MEGPLTDMSMTFRMRIGKYRRITLPDQLLAALGVQVGDVLVMDASSNTFFFERAGAVPIQAEADKEVTQTAVQLVSDSERMAGLPGKKQYQPDLARLQRTVVSYFSGLGVPSDVIMDQLVKVLEKGEVQEPAVQEESGGRLLQEREP